MHFRAMSLSFRDWKSEKMTKKPAVAILDTIPAEIRELMGSPPVLATEDVDLYYTMMAIFARSIKPDDLITWMLVKDLADHRLEIARYRQIKAGIFAASRRKLIAGAVSDYGFSRVHELTRNAERQKELLTKSKKPAEEIDKLKTEIESKLTADIAEAKAKGQAHAQALKNVATTETDYIDLFSTWIDDVERIDVLLHAAEGKFSATLEEIDRHIRGLGQLLREQVDKVIDGEFSEFQEAEGEPSEGAVESKSLSKNDFAHGPCVAVPAGHTRSQFAHARTTLQYSDNSRSARRQSRSRR